MTYLHRAREGGVEKVALRLIEHWSSNGAEVILVLAYAEGLEALQKDRRYRLMLAPQTSWPRWLEGLWMAIWLVRCVTTVKPDILFCPGNSYTISAVLAKMRLRGSCPPILAKISNGFFRPDLSPALQFLYQHWLRLQARFIDQFVAIAPPIVDEIVEIMGIERDRVVTICDPAIDRSFLRNTLPKKHHDTRSNSRYFLAVGRLVNQKNYPLLLTAFARYLNRRDGKLNHLIIVGEGPMETDLKILADDLGISARVQFAGYSDCTIQWYLGAHALLMSSDYEGLPAVLVEALAAGLPIVTTDCSVGISALVDDEEDGLIVPVNDCDAFAKAIEKATSLQPQHKAMREKAIRYSIEYSAPLYLNVLKKMTTLAV